MTKTDEIVENTRCLLSVLCSDVLFPRNCVGRWSCEGLPSHRLGTRKYHQWLIHSPRGTITIHTFIDEVRKLNSFLSHLKVLFTDAASFTQTLHDGFVPQNVLLA